MGKRGHQNAEEGEEETLVAQKDFLHPRSRKRVKLSNRDRLSSLSDEMLLRILSFLPVSHLVHCRRLSSKYKVLASDGQLWKSHYYHRFVRPRASRLPGLKDAGGSTGRLHFSFKTSKWLEDEHLVGSGADTNWMRQYKLRDNWTRGSCAVNEIEVAEQPAIPPLLVQMHEGIIYMADQVDGLRAWSAKGERKLLARIAMLERCSPPTALAIDGKTNSSCAKIVIGFEDGSFKIFALEQTLSGFTLLYSHDMHSNGVIAAAAISWPCLVTMTATQNLSLYQFDVLDSSSDASKPRLKLLHSLKSHNIWPPLTVSLRLQDCNILISVAYALPTYLSGWTVGLQEVRVSQKGALLDSRLASAIEPHYRPLAFSTQPIMNHLPSPAIGSLATSTMLEMRHIHSKPTSLSYAHPYLLVSHPDNTLTLYLVTSTAGSLSIGAGSRLWGHTSSVSGAHVGGRGKAVSISRRGDELRVWELEGGFASAAARKRLAAGDLSVQVRPTEYVSPAKRPSQVGLDLVSTGAESRQEEEESSELILTRGWIGFDDENVVVLKERSHGKQALVIYDFT